MTDPSVSNTSMFKDIFFLQKTYIQVFLRYFKKKRRFNIFFDKKYRKFFPIVIKSALALTSFTEEIIYQYPREFQHTKIQNFFGFVTKFRRTGFVYNTLFFSSGVYSRFSIMRTLNNYADGWYRSDETYHLDSFFSNVHMQELNSDASFEYSTKGALFSFSQKENKKDNELANAENWITIDDIVTPLITAYKNEQERVSTSPREERLAKLARMAAGFWFFKKNDTRLLVLFVLNSRFLSILKSFPFKNISSVYIKRMHNFFTKFSIFGGFFNNLSFVYKRYYSVLNRYLNYISKKKKKQITKIRKYRKLLKSRLRYNIKFGLRKKKKYRMRFSDKVKVYYIKKIFPYFLRTQIDNYYKKSMRCVTSDLTPSTFKKIHSQLQPLTILEAPFDPTDVFFDANLSPASKKLAIVTSFERNLLDSMQKATLRLNYFRNSCTVNSNRLFNITKVRNNLNLLGFTKKTYNTVLKGLLLSQVIETASTSAAMLAHTIFRVYTELAQKKSNDFHVQKFFPMNMHRVFLSSLKKVGNFTRMENYPNIFKKWHLKFFGTLYPNYKIILRPYKKLRGSVQINILSENDFNLFSSWPGLVFKEPEKIVGEHQEHKYIYLRFLKRKKAKLDYNAKLLAARHASNFLYNIIKKRPGTLEIIIRRPTDNMTKTLVDAVVPLYFWKNPGFLKPKKKFKRFEKKRGGHVALPSFGSLNLFNKHGLTKLKTLKYVFSFIASKLKNFRSVCLACLQNINVLSNFYFDTIVSELKIEIRQLILFLVFIFNMRVKDRYTFNIFKSLFLYLKKKEVTFTDVRCLLGDIYLTKKRRNNPINKIVNSLFFGKLHRKDFKFQINNYNVMHLKKFYKLAGSTFSKLGSFMRTKRISIMPEISHGSYQKPRKLRRV